jgi:hypothetical protein
MGRKSRSHAAVIKRVLLGEAELYYLHQAKNTKNRNERASRVQIVSMKFSSDFQPVVRKECLWRCCGDARRKRRMSSLQPDAELVKSNAVPLSRYIYFTWFSANTTFQ